MPTAKGSLFFGVHLLSALLLVLAGTPRPSQAQDLIRAVKAGRLDSVQQLLSRNPELLDVPDQAGYTPLRWAGIRNQGEIARLLLASGADPNTVGMDGGTPVHGAAHHDDGEMMEALLAAGGNVNQRNQWGRTPLHVAARRGCLAVAKLLLDAGADPNLPTNEGWTALNVAYRGGHPGMVALLLARGADPNRADDQGMKPGETTLVRPEPISLSRRELDDYVGRYDLGGGYGFDVWREGDEMRLMEFAPDAMLPVAVDTFFTAQEPWRVVFRRDDAGRVQAMDVAFLRRTVTAEKVLNPSAGFTYVGTGRCLGCHSSGPGDGPAGHWIASRHSRAFHTLTSDQARDLAAGRADSRDVTEPSEEPRCLSCHVTGFQDAAARNGSGFRAPEGVGCEACHGPGSAYSTASIMGDRASFLANGGRIPDWLTCRGCHRDEHFRFASMWERIRHDQKE